MAEENPLLKEMARTVDDLARRVAALEKAPPLNVNTESSDLAQRVTVLEGSLKGVNDLVTHSGGDGLNVQADHCLSPARKGLPDYEEARSKLSKIKPGETVEVKHLGKVLKADYATARELLRQAGI